ncbi:hypothetical protein AB0H07_16450 [Streptomyces sp. NPDC021354]|uniref:hypothetical protein n=1 Tax=Streptomyces sp. NPDC021354 TaxID=3154793 RepID=UPI0033D100D9
MDREIVTELVAGPRDENVRDALDEAEGWGSYAAELRGVLGAVIEASGADTLEVSELFVGQPLPDELSALRNGLEISPREAVDLAVGMAAGRGPYCRLTSTDQLRIESGWNGFVHLLMTPEMAGRMAGLHGDDVSLEWRTAAPEPADGSRIVDRPADAEFWAAVRTATAELTLLCERWAHGACGYRWFRVTSENSAEVAEAVRPRSLLCVVSDPELRLDADLLDDDFTAFKVPLTPGELTYRSYPGGADSLAEITDEGFTFMLKDSAMENWRAVVPDSDGVVRARWEDFREEDG